MVVTPLPQYLYSYKIMFSSPVVVECYLSCIASFCSVYCLGKFQKKGHGIGLAGPNVEVKQLIKVNINIKSLHFQKRATSI